MDERDYPEAHITEEYQCDCTQLRAENENEKLKADAKYGWQAHELTLKNQVLEAELADAKENAREWKLAASAATAMLETEQEKVKALEATWIGYNKLQEQLAAAREKVKELGEAERKLAIAREAMSSTLTMLLAESNTVMALHKSEDALRHALAQIGGDDVPR